MTVIGKTMLFNPFTGSPRQPDDIKSDPAGLLVWDGEEPLRAATPPGAVAAEDAPEANPNCVPQGFVEYIEKNYKGDVFFSDPAWHAARIWRIAMHFATQHPAPAVAVSAEVAAEVDAKLGLVTLPPIRLDEALHARLAADAAARGLIIQAHVRELLGAAPAVAAEAGQVERDAIVVAFIQAIGNGMALSVSDRNKAAQAAEYLRERLATQQPAQPLSEPKENT